MGYTRMIEKNLANHNMGLGALTTEVEELMFLEDDLRMIHFFEKDCRSLRRNNTFHKKVRLQKVAKFALDEITEKGKVRDSGYRTYLKGNKVWSRKVRREGKNLNDDRTDWFEYGANRYERELCWEGFEDFSYKIENHETWQQALCRKNHNGIVAWGLKRSLQTNKGLREAREAINERVADLNAEKKRLLGEYADRIEAINAEIRAINNR